MQRLATEFLLGTAAGGASHYGRLGMAFFLLDATGNAIQTGQAIYGLANGNYSWGNILQASFGLVGLAGDIAGRSLIRTPDGTGARHAAGSSLGSAGTGRSATRAPVLDGAGRYSDVGGHHVHAKAGMRGHATYDPQSGLSISQEFMEARGWRHVDMNRAQRRLFDELARSGRSNTLKEHTRIAIEALVESGATYAEARALVAHFLRDLLRQGVRSPTHIPWN